MDTVEWVFSGVGVAVMGWLGWLIWWFAKGRHQKQVPQAATVSTDPHSATSLSKSTSAVIHYFLKTTVRIRKGDYYSTAPGEYRTLRVEVADIREAEIPRQYGSSPSMQPAVELHIETGGGVVSGGICTINIGVNRFLVPRLGSDESNESVYHFFTRDDYCSMLRICVSHVNLHENIAEINILMISTSAR